MDNIDWENPNLLIDGGTSAELAICSGIETANTRILEAEIEKRIDKSLVRWDIRFKLPYGREHYIVRWERGDTIRVERSHNRNFFLFMERNPEQWRFQAVPTFEPILPQFASNLDVWGKDEFTSELGFLPPDCETGRGGEARGDVNATYLGILLWLRFRHMNDGQGKNLFREMLYTSPLIFLEPFADVSLARRDFAYAIYPWLPLAQRALGEDHLWFCLEYSTCLQKFHGADTSKTKYRSLITEGIRAYKKAFKKPPLEDEFLTIESLQQEDTDWRLHVQDLLIQAAIREYWELNRNAKKLREGCDRFLTRLSRYNGVVGHQKPYVIPELEKQQTKKKRGRPMGRKNVKNCKITPDFGNKQKARF